MKIAYIISAYKHPDQLVRLITRLNTRTALFLLHIDKQTDPKTYRTVVEGLSHFSNVIFLKRHRCNWGDFGHVLASIKGIKEVFARQIDCDYIFLLTGQDYPIKSNEYIEQFLFKHRGKQFIEHWPIPYKGWERDDGGLRRIEFWHFRLLNRYYCSGDDLRFRSRVKTFIWSFLKRVFRKRRFPSNLKPFGGSGYWCITKECAQYIVAFIKKNPRFVNYFKYVNIPDEIFFHTIVLNSPFSESVTDDDLRCIDWSEKRRSPRIWCKRDIEVLCRSKDLIARKFDSTVDSEVLDLIDARLLSKP